jgi:hypothetical protein
MVKTAVRSLNLKALEELLQQGLYTDPLSPIPLAVHCLLRDDTLIIVIEHNQPNVTHPKGIFRILQEILENEQIFQQYQVLSYLRLYDQQQPYAFDSLTPKTQTPIMPDLAEEMPDFDAIPDFDNFTEPETESLENQPEITPDQPDQADQPDQPIIDPQVWESLQAEADFAFDRFSEEIGEYSAKMKPKPKNLLLKLSLISILSSLGLFFALTRPCVLGKCSAIPQASQLALKSGEIAQKKASGKEILDSQTDLDQGIKLLRQIPFWSPHYSEAKQLLEIYQERSEKLAQVVEALKKGSKASSMSQNPPFETEKWQEIQQQWREAIATLETVTPQSEFYHFAQERLISYRQNLAAINQNLRTEEQGYINMRIAREAAQTAQGRQETAQSLQDWQLVYATWQTAIKRLEEISQNSTAFEKAKQLIAEYNPKMSEARDKKNYELFADNAFNQAIRLAELAKKSETINQWSAAVFNWRNSVSYLRQIPEKSFRYNQSQSLIQSYQGSLAKAQNQLQVAVKEQQSLNDLHETCSGNQQICTYIIDNHVIQVRLTNAYTEEIQKTALQAKVQESYTTQVQLLEHISTLEKALETISNQVGKRLEVYNSEGLLIINYQPS